MYLLLVGAFFLYIFRICIWKYF